MSRTSKKAAVAARESTRSLGATVKAATANPPRTVPRLLGRIVLGSFLLFAGIGHLTFVREEFRAQVPEWLPIDKDTVVVASGIVEITLGGALLALPGKRVHVGWIVAAYYVVIFGLNSDAARGLRLIFQPVLVLWALWCTGAWRAWRNRSR